MNKQDPKKSLMAATHFDLLSGTYWQQGVLRARGRWWLAAILNAHMWNLQNQNQIQLSPFTVNTKLFRLINKTHPTAMRCFKINNNSTIGGGNETVVWVEETTAPKQSIPQTATVCNTQRLWLCSNLKLIWGASFAQHCRNQQEKFIQRKQLRKCKHTSPRSD